MNIFEITLISLIILSIVFLSFKKYKKIDFLFIIFVTFILAFFNGFRATDIGPDTYRYYKSFQNITEVNLKDIFVLNSEIGYNFCQKIFSILIPNYNLWLIFVAVVTFSLLGIFIYKNSRNYFLSYLLFLSLGFYNYSFNIMRQFIALMITSFAFNFIEKKKFYSFFFFVLIASSFHLSAIIFLPAYFIGNIIIKKKSLIFLSVIATLLVIFRDQVANFVIELYYQDNAAIMISSYNKSDKLGGTFYFILLTLIIGRLLYKPKDNNDKKNNILFNLMFFSLIIQSFSSFSYLFTRLNLYYFFYIIIYIPLILDRMNLRFSYYSKNNELFKFLIKSSVTFVLIVYYFFFNENIGDPVLPYDFFL